MRYTDEDNSSSSSEVDEDAVSDDNYERDNKHDSNQDSTGHDKKLGVAIGKEVAANGGAKEENEDNKTSVTSIKEGWLWKKHRKGKLWTGWHRRYFLLEENKLEYYRSPQKVRNKRPLGLIIPDSDHRVEFSRRKAGKHDFYEFIIHTPISGMYILAGLTEVGVQSWVDALTGAMRNFPGASGASGNPQQGPNIEEIHGAVVKKGFLYRRHPTGKILRSWHKRYFVLFATGRLEWYRIDYKRTRMPRGNLQLGTEWKLDFPRNLKKTKKATFSPFTLLGPKNDKLELGGDTAEESEAWVHILLHFLQPSDYPPPAAVLGSPLREPLESVNFSPPRHFLEPSLSNSASSFSSSGPSSSSSSSSSSTSFPSLSFDSNGNAVSPEGKFLVSPRKTILLTTHKSNDFGNSNRQVKSQESKLSLQSDEQLIPLSLSENTMEGFLYKKYAFRRQLSSVWRRRYFVLKSHKLEFFQDERMKKLQGSVYLGSDCLVDFPGTTTIRAGNEVYPFSIFAENSENNQVWLKNALLLGSPSKEEAQRWVEALQLTIHSRPEVERQISVVRDDDRLNDVTDDDDDDNEDNRRAAFHSLDLSVDGTKLWIPNDFESSNEPVYVDGQSDPGPAGSLRCVAVLKSGHNRAILVGRNVNYDTWLSVGIMCQGDLLIVVVSDGRSPDGKTCRCLPPAVPRSCALGYQFPAARITARSASTDPTNEDEELYAVSAVWQYLGEVSSSAEKFSFFTDKKMSLLLLMVALLIVLSNISGNALLSTMAVILGGLIFARGRQSQSKQGPVVWSLKLEKGGAEEPVIEGELPPTSHVVGLGPSTRGQLIPQGFIPTGCTGYPLVTGEMDSVTKTWPAESGWAIPNPESFNVRIGPDYYTTGRPKAPSARYMYRQFELEVSLSPHKLGEATPFFKFTPEINQQLDHLQQLQNDRDPDDRIPPLVVVNFQIPLYPAANPIWGPKKFDGLSANTQMFAILEEWVLTEPETPPVKLWKKYYHASNDDKDIKDRFKIISTLVNVDELDLNRVERALERKFNSTPWFSKPDYTCYHGRLALETKETKASENVSLSKPECEYFEIVTDGHTFSYLARSTVGSVVESFKRMVVNVGFVIEGRTNEELPEQMLFGFRIHKVDILNAPKWDTILTQYVNEEKKERQSLLEQKDKVVVLDEKPEDEKARKRREKKEKAEREEKAKKEERERVEREDKEKKELKKREKEERKEKERREKLEREEKEKEQRERQDREAREKKDKTQRDKLESETDKSKIV